MQKTQVQQNIKETFQENGFLILKNLVSVELIDSVFAQIHELLDYTLSLKKVNPKQFTNLDQKYLYLRDHFPGVKRNIYNLMKHLDSLHHIANLKEVTDTVKALTDSLLFIDSTQIRVDDATNDFILPLHQEAFGCISYNAVTAWIPMIDIDRQTGGIRFVKGSHKQGFVKHGFQNNYHVIEESVLSKVGSEEIPDFQKGDALFFDSKLFHGSNPMSNRDGIRWTIVSRYNPKVNVPCIEDEGQPLRTEKIDTTR